MKHRRISLWTAAALLALVLAAAAIGCKQNADTDEKEAAQSGLTLKGTKAGLSYAVRVYPNPEDEADGFDAWTEATAEAKLAAQGAATAEGAEVLVGLSAPPSLNQFAPTDTDGFTDPDDPTDTDDSADTDDLTDTDDPTDTDADESAGTGVFVGTGSFLVVVTTDADTRYAVAAILNGSAALELKNMKNAPENPDHRLELSQTETYVFPSANEGYSAQTATTITVTNTGKEDTGTLTLAVSEADSDVSSEWFALNRTTITNIDAGLWTAFTVKPNTGLAAGFYTATVSVRGEAMAAKSFGVSFTVNKADGSPPDGTPPVDTPPDDGPGEDPSENGVYAIELSRTGMLIFPPVNAGAEPSAAKAVTVKNTGNQPTGALTVALSGGGSSAFALSATAINSIAVKGADSFTIVPNTRLKAGAYTETVTVSGANKTSASFNVSFTVTPDVEPFYGIELSIGDSNINDTHALTDAILGYEARTPQAVTIRNTGNQPTGHLTVALSGTDSGSFTVTQPNPSSIARADETAQFTVVPKLGLKTDGDADKTYTATVTVTNKLGGKQGISESFGVSFTVKPVPRYGIELSRTATLVFANAVVGDPVPAAQTITISNRGNQPTGELKVELTGYRPTSFTASHSTIPSIAAGGSADFTVGPRADRQADTHTATVTVSGGSGDSAVTASFDVSFVVEPVTYSVALSQTATYIFDARALPSTYTPPAALTVTITNDGNQPTGALSVALGGDDGGSFTVTQPIQSSLAAKGDSTTFNVRPSGGLTAARTYEATVTVSNGLGGDQSISRSFGVRFAVNPLPTYGITLLNGGAAIGATYSFGTEIQPYTAPAALTVTVQNYGNQPTGTLTVELEGTDPGSFTVTQPNPSSLAASGNTAAFTVVPKATLTVTKTHTATVKVRGSNGGTSAPTASFGVSFAVEAATYRVALSSNGSDLGAPHTFDAVTLPGYTQPAALSVTITNTGNKPTGALSVGLSGTDSGSFTVTQPIQSSLAAKGDSTTFTVVPRGDLTATKTHAATVTVSGSNGITATFGVSFEVRDPLVSGFTNITAALARLDTQAGTVDTPAALKLNLDLSSTADGWNAFLTALANKTKYVALDLSSCSMSGTEFDLYESNVAGKNYIVSLVLPDSATGLTGGGGRPIYQPQDNQRRECRQPGAFHFRRVYSPDNGKLTQGDDHRSVRVLRVLRPDNGKLFRGNDYRAD